MLHILQVGLGPLGTRIATDLAERKLGRVIEVVDPAPGLVGRPLSDCLNATPHLLGDPEVRASLDDVADWDLVRVALVTTSSKLEDCLETFRTLLRQGKTVLSTCEELSWPWLRHPVLAQELHELAVRFGGRLLGTGINPGFLMDALPVALATAAREVRSVRIERIQDASTRRIPFQRKIGATLTREAFDAGAKEGRLLHVGLGESLHFVAHYLGFELSGWDESIEPVIADQPLECGLGPIPAGGVSGVRQVARGTSRSGGELELVFVASIGQADPRDRVVIEGDPPLEMILPGGVHGDVSTSAVMLNSMRSLQAAPPGLHTMATLPLQGCARPKGWAPRL